MLLPYSVTALPPALEDALRVLSAGSAYAAFAEDRPGILKTGMHADLTVINADLFRAAPPQSKSAVGTS